MRWVTPNKALHLPTSSGSQLGFGSTLASTPGCSIGRSGALLAAAERPGRQTALSSTRFSGEIMGRHLCLALATLAVVGVLGACIDKTGPP